MNAGSRCGNDRVYKHMPSLMPLEEMKLVYVHPTSVSRARTRIRPVVVCPVSQWRGHQHV
jgi:hypothetical protein